MLLEIGIGQFCERTVLEENDTTGGSPLPAPQAVFLKHILLKADFVHITSAVLWQPSVEQGHREQ